MSDKHEKTDWSRVTNIDSSTARRLREFEPRDTRGRRKGSPWHKQRLELRRDKA